MRREVKVAKYKTELEKAQEILRINPDMAVTDLARALGVSRHVAEFVRSELSLPPVVDALTLIRKALSESAVSDYKSLSKETGLSLRVVQRILLKLPNSAPERRILNVNRRAARFARRRERESPIAERLAAHLNEGGSIGTFAAQERISPTTARRIYSRHMKDRYWRRPSLQTEITEEEVERMSRLANEGRTVGEIAQELGVEKETATYFLNRYLGTIEGDTDLLKTVKSGAWPKPNKNQEKKGERFERLLRFAERVAFWRSRGLQFVDMAARMGLQYRSLRYRLRQVEALFPGRFPGGALRSYGRPDGGRRAFFRA
jgi:AraC-like DNA-binding protein